MKQTVLDILRYLFDHYMDDEWEYAFDKEFLQAELREAGFEDAQVDKAFAWLQGLAVSDEIATGQESNGIRVYTLEEQRKFCREAQGFLLLLEQVGVLGHHTRELVIDRVMALEAEIDLPQLKWIVLMVLFNQKDHEEPLMWMEYMMDECSDSRPH